jgi:hypothetical protein
MLRDKIKKQIKKKDKKVIKIMRIKLDKKKLNEIKCLGVKLQKK